MKITSFGTHVLAEGYLEKMKCTRQYSITFRKTSVFITTLRGRNTCIRPNLPWEVLVQQKVQDYMDMRRVTTGIRSEKCVVRQFHHCANVTECTYTNLDSIAYYTPRLYGIAYGS